MKLPRGNETVRNRVTSTNRVDTSMTQSAASSFQGAAGLASKWIQQEDEAKTQEAINTAMTRMNDWKSANLKREGKAAEGLTEEYLQFAKELENEVGQNLSRNARSRFNQWTFATSEQDRMAIMNYQHKQGMMVKQSAFNEGVTLSEELVRQDAKQWQRAMEHLGNSIDLAVNSGVIPEEQADAKRIEFTNKMRNEIGKSYYTQDKHDFIKNIDQFGFGESEKAYYLDKYQKDLVAEERERKALFSEEAKLLYARKDDMKAQALANGETTHYFESANKLRKMGYNEWANNLEEEGKIYQKVVEFNADKKNLPLKDIIQSAQGLAVGSDLDGSSIEYKSRQMIQKEVINQAKLYNKDPAGYVSKWAQGETMEEILDSRISLQRSQGIYPEKGFKVLTAEENKNFKGAWESGDIQQKTNLVLESFRYGKHTPQVLDEIGVNSALSLAPLIGFSGLTGVDNKAVEMLVAGVATKPEILEDQTKANYKIEAKNTEIYKVLTKVQQAFPTNPDLPEKLKDIETAIIGISSRMVDQTGGAKFMDSKISAIESSDKMLYFPTTVDEDELETYLDNKKNEVLERFKTGDPKKDQSAKWALRDAVWINSSNGFILADPKSGSYIDGSEVNYFELEPDKKNLARRELQQKFKSAEESPSRPRFIGKL